MSTDPSEDLRELCSDRDHGLLPDDLYRRRRGALLDSLLSDGPSGRGQDESRSAVGRPAVWRRLPVRWAAVAGAQRLGRWALRIMWAFVALFFLLGIAGYISEKISGS